MNLYEYLESNITKEEIASKLREIAKLEKDKWKSIAYHKAANSINEYKGNITKLQDFKEIPGVGKSISEKILVAETDDSSVLAVNENMWRVAQCPYVLLHQDRTKYIHLKILYANNTYATMTLPPVENFLSIFTIAPMLVSIIIVLTLLYMYGNNVLTFFKRK